MQSSSMFLGNQIGSDCELFGELEPENGTDGVIIDDKEVEQAYIDVGDELDALIDHDLPQNASSEADDAPVRGTASLATASAAAPRVSELLVKSAFEEGLSFVPSSSSLSQLSLSSPRLDPISVPVPVPPTGLTAAPATVAAAAQDELEVRSMGELYSRFWELSFKLFLNVCSPHSSCRECLSVIEDMVRMIHKWGQLHSPVLIVALDVVTQRAMYELSDKLCKPDDAHTLTHTHTAESDESSPSLPAADGVENIESCVSLMTHVVLPLCWQVQSDFHCNFLTEGTQSLGAKTQTLNRQLQELTAWTSVRGQCTAAPTFPPASASASVRDRVCETDEPSECVHVSAAALEKLDLTLLHVLTESPAQPLSHTTHTHTHLPHGPPAPLSLSREFLESVQQTISLLASRHTGVPVDVRDCGTRSLFLHAAHSPQNHTQSAHGAHTEGWPELHLVLLSQRTHTSPSSPRLTERETHTHTPSLATPTQTPRTNASVCERETERECEGECVSERERVCAALCACERFTSLDALTDAATKHVRACVKDALSLTHELLAAVHTHSHPHSHTHLLHAHPHSHSPHNAQLQYYGILSAAIEEDAEHLRRLTELLCERVESLKLHRLHTHTALSMATQKQDLLVDCLERPDRDRSSHARRLAKALEKPLRDAGFAQVRCVTARTRFTHLSFTAYDARVRVNVPCTLYVESELPLRGCELLREYLRYDHSGKLRAYVSVVRRFANAHRIDDAAAGYLSPFAWTVMALHVLLRMEIVPNLHEDVRTHTHSQEEKEKELLFSQARLHSVSLWQLLDIFFRYYVHTFDAFTQVVSLRGQGRVLRKMDWHRGAVLWRISVEDPFAPQQSRGGFDIGSSLSRPGQLTTFKALRRAVYGVRSVVSLCDDSPWLNMKKLFSRSELIHLARRSDYVGASILPPVVWQHTAVSRPLLSLRSLCEPLSAEQQETLVRVCERAEEVLSSLSLPQHALSHAQSQSYPNTARSALSLSASLCEALPLSARSASSTASVGVSGSHCYNNNNNINNEHNNNHNNHYTTSTTTNMNISTNINTASSISSGAAVPVPVSVGGSAAGSAATGKRPAVPLIPLQALHTHTQNAQSTTYPHTLSHTPEGGAHSLSAGLNVGVGLGLSARSLTLTDRERERESESAHTTFTHTPQSVASQHTQQSLSARLSHSLSLTPRSDCEGVLWERDTHRDREDLSQTHMNPYAHTQSRSLSHTQPLSQTHSIAHHSAGYLNPYGSYHSLTHTHPHINAPTHISLPHTTYPHTSGSAHNTPRGSSHTLTYAHSLTHPHAHSHVSLSQKTPHSAYSNTSGMLRGRPDYPNMASPRSHTTSPYPHNYGYSTSSYANSNAPTHPNRAQVGSAREYGAFDNSTYIHAQSAPCSARSASSSSSSHHTAPYYNHSQAQAQRQPHTMHSQNIPSQWTEHSANRYN